MNAFDEPTHLLPPLMPPVVTKLPMRSGPVFASVALHEDHNGVQPKGGPRESECSGPPEVVAAWLRAWADQLAPPAPVPQRVSFHGMHPNDARGEDR